MDLERLVKMIDEKAEEKQAKREAGETMRGADSTYQEFTRNAQRGADLRETLANLRGDDAGI